MKVFKRDAVIVTVLLFVCVAVYLNWSYNKKERDVDAAADAVPSASVSPEAAGDAANSDAGLYYTGTVDEEEGQLSVQIQSYFDEVRLSRQQARDEATATLQVVTTTEGANQTVVDEAMAKMTVIADRTVLEAELESLIMAKGFADCVVYIMDDSVSVTVPSPIEGLSSALVAQITDLVTGETELPASALKIIEIK